jgi:hypothetical protein
MKHDASAEALHPAQPSDAPSIAHLANLDERRQTSHNVLLSLSQFFCRYQSLPSF